MLIHLGWFTALYTQHLLDSQTFEVEICILQALKLHQRISKGGYPVPILPSPRRLVPCLGLGTTWVRQPRSGSCHHPTAATRYNKQPSQTTSNPVGGKACSSTRVVYCAIYSTLTPIHKLSSLKFAYYKHSIFR